jgi:S1-C subfamily serine protease
MLLGTTIDNLVVGGPAYNSRQLFRGDVISKVDGVPVTQSNVHEAIVGNDVPGSQVTISVARGGATVRVSRLHNPAAA